MTIEITEPGGENPYAAGDAFPQDQLDAPARGLFARVFKSAVRVGKAAIAWGRGQITKPSQDWARLCLMFVRSCHNVPAKYADAGTAWDKAEHKHRTTDGMSIPAGVPVFFETPGKADHVAETIGDGLCLTNDWGTGGRGKIRVARIADIARTWGPLLGWTEDINGVRVYTPPAPVKKPPKEPAVIAKAALLKDLREVCRKHGVTRIYGGRLLLKSAGTDPKIPAEKRSHVNAARKLLFGIDDPKK